VSLFCIIENKEVIGDNVRGMEGYFKWGSSGISVGFVIYLNDLILSLTITSKIYAEESKLISINNKNDNIQQELMQDNLNLIYGWKVDWKCFLMNLNAGFCILVP
jgi:beta-galactosidase/beta-glucuronidase